MINGTVSSCCGSHCSALTVRPATGGSGSGVAQRCIAAIGACGNLCSIG
jgi:hypothetical protein